MQVFPQCTLTFRITDSHKPLRRSLRPLLSRSLSSPISILCSSFLSCSSLSRDSWELVFLFCSMFSMFFPISSKSLSSAELLSVSVESTSVDSNTLWWGRNKEKDSEWAQTESSITQIALNESLTCSAGQRSSGTLPCNAPGVQQQRNESLWQTCSWVPRLNVPALWTWFSPRQSPPSARAS